MQTGPNLTIVAFWTRRVIKFTALAIVFVIGAHLVWKIAYHNWLRAHPPAPPPPNVAFGTLPRTEFQEPKQRPQKFRLETVTGSLPKLPNQDKVYFVIAQQSRLLAFDKANNLARQLGFIQPPNHTNDNLLHYHRDKTGEVLTINPLTGNFHYRYPIQHDQTIMSQLLPPDLNQIQDTAYTYLKGLINQPLDLITPGEITFYKLTPQGLQLAHALADANLARVSYHRQAINQHPLLPPNWQNPNISVWVSGNGSRNIVEAKFVHFPIDQEKYATYPLLPIAQAWAELKKGHFHLANIDSAYFHQDNAPIIIRKVYLAYVNPNYATNFLKPVYVFSGSNNFIGYVEAISPDFLEPAASK